VGPLIVKEKKDSTINSILEYYLSYSFWSSLFLFSSFHIFMSRSIDDQIFISTLLVMNFYFYLNGSHKGELLKENSLMPAYFLAQTLLLLGASFFHQSIGSLYLSILPIAAGTYFFISKANIVRVESLYKGINLFFIASSSYVLFSLYHQKSLLSISELICLTGFLLWSTGTVFYGVRLTFKQHKSHFVKFLRRSKYKKVYVGDENKEKYFFHDLINITHGLNLFLDNRVNNGLEISTEETASLITEVKLLESMIQNHFNYNHKNLNSRRDIIPFNEVKSNLYQTIQSYLPSDQVECHFVYNGFLSADSSIYQKELALVHFPSFSRIMGNIVKNMSEVRTTQAEFIFNYDLRGLHVITKNKIYKLIDDRQNLAEKMKEMILKDQKLSTEKIEGVGLKSIQSQVEFLGGEFRFKIENGYWVCELFIPRITVEEVEEPRSAA
jgi:hypothetical protein